MTNKGGRPKKEIDKYTFEKLCAIHCTEKEICDIFDTTDKTLSSWCKRNYGFSFSETYKKFLSMGKMSLRRTQWKLAERNPSMAIWLGKQYLGQTEKVEQTNSYEDLTPLAKLLDIKEDE